jgi:hypothetical protein
MKFVANHLVAIHNVATAEAMILAQRAGPRSEDGSGRHGRPWHRRFPDVLDVRADDGRRRVRTRNNEDIDLEEGHGNHCRVRRGLWLRHAFIYAHTAGLRRGHGNGSRRSGYAAFFEVLKKIITADEELA